MAYHLELGEWVRVRYRRENLPVEEMPYGRVCEIKKRKNWQIKYGAPEWNIRYVIEMYDGKKFRRASYYRDSLMPCDEPEGDTFALWALGKWKE